MAAALAKPAALATSMCAWPAGLVLIYMTEERDDLKFHQVLYKNSGDSKLVRDKSEVVGYYAITLEEERNTNTFRLSRYNIALFFCIPQRCMAKSGHVTDWGHHMSRQ